MVAVNLPEGATLSRTIAVLDKVQGFMSEDPDIVDKAGIAGFDILASAQKSSGGLMFATLSDWSQRKGAGQDVNSKSVN